MFALNRPSNLNEFIGQRHLLGANAPIVKMIENNTLIHMFFFGPPGCGKTSLARILSKELGVSFIEFNATSLKIEDLRKSITKDSLLKQIIFIDEFHRLNKAQQEVLLPFMENFDAIFIGASTQNPYFALTGAIRSRSMIFEFYPLSKDELKEILELNIRKYELHIDKEAKDYIISSSNGDARAMLNLLSISRDNLSLESLKKIKPISEGVSEESVHYDLISALIKSIRGSDENASIYYLARLINAGESAEFIARRLVILASEDIGNANPNALNIATSTMQSVSKIGYPESRIILSQCVLYLVASPKSNTAYKAINKAIEYVEKNKTMRVPENIKHFNKNYKYPHDFGGFVKQKYLEEEYNFVQWSNIGFEKTLQEWLEKIKNINK
ncbi:replication-associated recombination protein A [Helicobacter sp. MIT 14-3879]|uniref:replication-associated recombination protein A n=1 Tax=Helicobacter sp. MIT 14-3879 TaxID=2040649 RepID=UPI000E1EF44A|nr:replication-associated recombination protein A [Helicobacter sp. MIT 14-3879]RDU64819.1 recombinase RarA [Helicobacter sp. MIT 14-3879]